MKKIEIKLDGKRSYQVIIGQNHLDTVGDYLQGMDVGRSVFIITDDKVGKIYAERLKKIFRKSEFGDVGLAWFPAGEKSKTWKTYLWLLKELVKFDGGHNKRILVVNLGGGVVGDVGGFVAATFRRGIDYVQMPTSLLANVDSGVGGKVGIDFAGVKNLLGSFYQPKLVFVDLSLLKTLAPKEVRCGLAEVVKYGVISDRKFFRYLEKNYKDALALNLKVISPVVVKSYQIKARIVEEDERDTKGIRMILNYGHTIGHAVEAASDYRYSHGEAVAIGMSCANDIACNLAIFSRSSARRIENLLVKIGLPVRIDRVPLNRIMHFIKYDKKVSAGTNRFVLPVDLGRVVIKKEIPLALIENVIRQRTSGTTGKI
ncbi:MAG: 3-dehydroquinate synthase [Candidatus Omnitrophota bacterium]